jgi:hypothetical protein
MTKPFIVGDASGQVGRYSAEQANAVLFHQVAQFVLWGQTHNEVAAAYPEFGRLLRNAAEVLTRSGSLERATDSSAGKRAKYFPDVRGVRSACVDADK